MRTHTIKKSRKKVIGLIIAAIIVLLAAYLIFGGSPMTVKVVNAKVSNTGQAQHIQAQGQLTYKNSTEHFTPVDGIIKKVHVKEGDTVTKGDHLADIEVTMGTETFTKKMAALDGGEVLYLPFRKGDFIDRGELLTDIGDRDKMEVVGFITEFNYMDVEKGKKVVIESNAFDDTFEGEISYVGTKAVPDEQNKGARVEIAIDADFGDLKPIPGLNVFLTIENDKQTAKDTAAVYRIPETAVLEENNRYFVFVVQDGKLEKREIELEKDLLKTDEEKGIGNDQMRIWIEKDQSDEEIMSALVTVTSGIETQDVIVANPDAGMEEGDVIHEDSVHEVQ